MTSVLSIEHLRPQLPTQSGLRAELLDFDQPDELTMAAAGILAAGVYKDYADDRGSRYIDRNTEEVTHYGLIDDHIGVVAAAAVIHGYNAGKETVTWVRAIAVDPSARKQGHARTLMTHVASRAIHHGDQRLGLTAFEPEVMTSLGFSGRVASMRAEASDLLTA